MTGLGLKELFFQVHHYFSQIWVGWSFKLPLSALVVFYTGHLGGDATALITWFVMIAMDLFFGTLLAFKLRRFEVKIFGYWVIKVGTHCFVIIVAGVAFRSILEPMGLEFRLLDLFLGLLICTEALSVLKNMKKLGLPVPERAMRFINQIKGKAERRTADFFNKPENDRRRHPRRPPGHEVDMENDDG